MARLVVKSGKEAGQTLDLTRATILGRGETVQLRISDAKASREHCRLFEQAGAWVVADLNSRNGITVNGIKTTRKTLKSGDVIAIGLTQVVYEARGGGAGGATGDTGEVFPEKKRPAAAKKKSAAATAREQAFAAARADAGKGGGGRKGAAASKSKRGGDGGDEGTQISDRVLQFSKVDARKAGLLDYDISQMSGTARFLITLGGIAILAAAVWGVSLAVG